MPGRTLPDLAALGLPVLHLKVDKFGHVRVREDPVATPAADFPEAQCLHEAHQVIEAHVGDVSAPDSRKEKTRLHTADVTERARQDTPRQKIAAVRQHATAYLNEPERSAMMVARAGRWVGS